MTGSRRLRLELPRGKPTLRLVRVLVRRWPASGLARLAAIVDPLGPDCPFRINRYTNG